MYVGEWVFVLSGTNQSPLLGLQISANKFDSFLVKIEEGYRRHGNPYHNACHGADVAQTVHYLLHATGFEVWSYMEAPLLKHHSCEGPPF